MKGMRSLPRRVTGNPENNIVHYTCRNLEINPSSEISVSSVTALCMSRCTRMHLLHAFSASVMKSLLFFPLDLKIWTNAVKHEPWTAAYSPLLKTRPPKTSHNALDKHLDPGRATPKWRIRAFTRERYHSCKKKKKKGPNMSPTEYTTLPSCLNWIKFDL